MTQVTVAITHGFITITGGHEKVKQLGFGKAIGAQKGTTPTATGDGISVLPPDTLIISRFEYEYLKQQGAEGPAVLLSDDEKARYAVFAQFIESGRYVKDGMKYGCDFMVYERHPEECHSTFGVLLLRSGVTVQFKDVIGLSRLLHNVKKRLLIGTLRDSRYELCELGWYLMDNKEASC